MTKNIKKPKILVTWPLNVKRFEKYHDNFQIDVLESAENRRQQVLDRISEYHGVLNMTIHADEEIFSKAKNLKIIANYGVGYDNIDTISAEKYRIAVSNTPISTTNPTANHTIGIMLSLMRKITEHDKRLKEGSLENWYSGKELGRSPERKQLGIIGMGRIGKAVAHRAKSFGMSIVYFNRKRLTQEIEDQYGATYIPLNYLLETSDIVSLHTPLTDESRGLISSRELTIMKPTAFLINTARGGIVDESALIRALKNKEIAGAGIDVFENEPHPRPDFFSLENVVLTPHSGTGTREARNAMMDEALGNIMAFLNGKEMTSRIV